MKEIESVDEAALLVEILAETAGETADIPFASIHSVSGGSGDVEAALRGVYRIGEETFPLEPPVDWWREPYEASDGRAFFQNSFVFAETLLGGERSAEVLDGLATVFADWLAANPREGALHPHRYAWHDHAAAGRLVYMAFVLREGIRGGKLDGPVAQTLAEGVLDHAAYLLAEENYAAHYNHGLFSDAALALAARSLVPAPQAAVWMQTAEQRFGAVLGRTVAPQDALHLEHSPYYQWVIHRAICRFSAAGLFKSLDLDRLGERMEDSGAWLVAPDGSVPPIGDSPEGRRPPPAVLSRARACTGLRAFREAGYVAVREGESALFVTAAHHPTAHKHADDGSFCLYENGAIVVGDAGDPGHEYESPERRYGTSPAAHSTISVDGFDWTAACAPYGSGVLDAAEAAGVYSVLVRNPAAVPGGGAARRLLAYAPGRFLVVLDDVEAGPGRTLERHLPLGPDLGVAALPDGRLAIQRGGSRIAELVPFAGPGAAPDGTDVAIGRLVPSMAGFAFPAPGRSRPRCDVTLSASAGEPRAFALFFDGAGGASPTLDWEERRGDVRVEIGGLAGSALRLELAADSIEEIALVDRDA